MMSYPPCSLLRPVTLGLVLTVAALAVTTAPAAGQTGPPAAVDGSADRESQTVGREDPSTPRAVLASAAAELARILEARGDDGVRRGLVSRRR